MAVAAMKHMALNFVKLDKFEWVDFRRWQRKMHFLLYSMSVVYVLTTPMSEYGGDNPTVEQVRKRAKWDNNDYDSLEAKYMVEDASSKKFLISNFTNYKITDSRPVLEQYNELLGILGRFTQHKMNMDEAIQVSCIIDKLSPFWKDFKHTLKQKKKELTLIELGSHLRIEESLRVHDSDKPKGNNVAGLSVVNIMEHNNSTRYNDNKVKRKHHDNTRAILTRRQNLLVGNVAKVVTLKGFAKFYYVTYVSKVYFVHDDDVVWWVDSGATVLICKDRCWFKTYESLNNGSILHMGNESTALVHGRGCVDLWFSSGKIVSLLNVLDVPNIRKNLLSNHMSRLNIVNDNIALAFFSTSKLNDSILWHARLGHVHFKRMQDMSKYGLIPTFDMDTGKCKTSMLTKITKKPFQNVKLKTKVLELIHSDLCDLHATHSLGNKKYFVTFIDGASRFSLVPRLNLRIPNRTEDIGGLVVPEEVTEEVVQQPEPELRKSKMNRTLKNFGPKFQVYLIEETRVEDVAFWKEVINDEIDFIMGNNTWVLDDLPLRIDYFDTYAPVACISTIRLLIAMASIHNLIIHQMDVWIAFLNGELEMVNWKRRYTSNPGTQQWQAIKRVLKYLKKTMDYRLTYIGYLLVLEGFTDASWISNTKENSSTSGWVFMLGGGAISWASKKQTCITGSTMEYEFVALAAAGKEAECAATLAKAYSQMYNEKSRHLGVRHSMIHELITNRVDTQLPAEETWQLSSMWKAERDANPIHTLGGYSKPGHEGYKNTIELPVGNNVVPLRSDTIRLVQNECSFHRLQSEDQNQHLKDFLKLMDSLELDGENRERMRLEINDKMAEMFGLLKELTTSKAPKKVLIREEGKSPVTKNVNSISLARGKEERNNDNDVATGEDIEKPTRTETGMPINETENGIKNEPIRKAKKEETTEAPSSQLVEYYLEHMINEKQIEGLVDNHRFNDSLSGARVGKIKGRTYNLLPRGPVYEAILRKKITMKEDIGGNFKVPCNIGGQKHMNALVDQGSNVNVMPLSTYIKLTDERPAEMDIRLSLASQSYIYPLGIAEDVLVKVAKHVYLVDFIILDIKENEKRPFILGTPFLITAKAVIKFDKGTITRRSGKNKISFNRIPESLCKDEKGIKNDIEPIAPTMTVNRLVLEWEEKIKLHQEKEMEFDRWRNKNFKNERPAPVKIEDEVDDKGEVTRFLIKNEEEIFTDPGDGVGINTASRLQLYLTRRSLEVLRKFHWTILGGRFNQLSHVSSPLLSKPGEY
ncbi:zinc finger, CCHC-type containing protein [Tanacetum coccineum]